MLRSFYEYFNMETNFVKSKELHKSKKVSDYLLQHGIQCQTKVVDGK